MWMRRALVLILAAVVLAWPVRAAPSLPEQYAAVYLKINDAEHAERKGDFKEAVDTFTTCYQQLAAIQKSDPDWQAALVLHRLADCKAKIIELTPQVAMAGVPLGQANAVPVAAPANPVEFVLAPQRPHIYPWKDNIAASQFWVGKDGAKGSAWEPNWVHDNGGPDVPDNCNGYADGAHASSVNPFYVALPFNDLAHADLAQKWLPKGWARAARDGKPVSACKDRWVELKNARGDVCYAQWEDCGPKGDDRAEYVFGGTAPGTGEAGIDLSPSAYEYLGLSVDDSLLSWRFADDADVRPGAWLKMDEQAVMFTAMHRVPAK